MINHVRFLDAEVMRDDRVEIIAQRINDVLFPFITAQYYLLYLCQYLVALDDLISLKPSKWEPLRVEVHLSHSFTHQI